MSWSHLPRWDRRTWVTVRGRGRVDLSKDELFLRIRRDSWQEGLSIRALSRKYGVHRRLVREALASPSPKPRKTPVRRSPRLEPFKKTIDEWLMQDLEAPPKQRHTVQRILTRLQRELGAEITPNRTGRLRPAVSRSCVACSPRTPRAAPTTCSGWPTASPRPPALTPTLSTEGDHHHDLTHLEACDR